MQIEWSNGKVHKLKLLTVASDSRWTPSHVRLPVEPVSICIQQDGAWKGIGGVIIEILVSVPQTRWWRFELLMTHVLHPLPLPRPPKKKPVHTHTYTPIHSQMWKGGDGIINEEVTRFKEYVVKVYMSK